MAVCAFLLGACRATADVAVDVGEDGSGTVAAAVHLDDEAAARVGDPAMAVAVEDLRAAGWTVAGPVRTKGSTTLRASKRFGSPAGLQQVMAELGRGLFSDWRIRIDDGFGSTTTKVTGRVHLTGSLDQFGDDELTKALDGLPLGRSPEQLAAEGGGKAPTVPLTLTVRLPHDVTVVENQSDARTEGRTRSWTFEVGNGTAVDRELGATSETGGTLPLLAVVGGVIALLAAGLLVLTPARHARSRRRTAVPMR